ncbi:MAG: hypothetical protein U0169_04090 [Polyangiaceae bacterium]
MLDLDESRTGVPTRDAATLVLVRNATASEGGIEVFCVERNKKSRFLGGAVVFPGGAVDPSDRDPVFAGHTDPWTASPRARALADDADALRALYVAACRESLEEAAIVPSRGVPLDHDQAVLLRHALVKEARPFADVLRSRGLTIDASLLVPFARWVTPIAEARRFDARFFLAALPEGQEGVHDEHETTASFWASPSELLRRFDAEEIVLAPPTHRTLELLVGRADVDDALAFAHGSDLSIILPKMVRVTTENGRVDETTVALVLPGDPDHDVATSRIPGLSRYVLRGKRFVPEAAPSRRA